MRKRDFNAFRFEGLNHRDISNNYWTMNRVNELEDRVVVKVSDDHLIKTRHGYALVLDKEHVVFLKNWNVSKSYYGNEVMLTKAFFNVKKWGTHDAFASVIEENHSYDTWVEIAKGQKETDVKWSKVIEIG